MQQTSLDRRTLAKGAAWAAPALTLAAGAPMLAGSTPPPCPTCLSVTGGAFTAQAVTVLGLSNVTGTAAFNIDASACPLGLFNPTYALLGLGGSVTWSDGTSNPLISASAGVGTFGAVSLFNSTFTMFGVNMPNASPFGAYPKKPTKLCYNFNAIFTALLVVPTDVSCNYTVCFDVTTTSIGTVALGTGTVNWTGLTTNPVLTYNP